MSVVRQNFNSECEAAINKQINMELYAGYVYQAMVSLRDLRFFSFWRSRGKSKIKFFVSTLCKMFSKNLQALFYHHYLTVSIY